MKAQLERIAVVLTPIVFAPVASVAAAWLATNFPGLPHVTPAEITGVEVTAFVTAGGLVYKWLHGRQLMMRLVTQKPEIAGYLNAGMPGAVGVHQATGLSRDEATKLIETLGPEIVATELNRRLGLSVGSATSGQQ